MRLIKLALISLVVLFILITAISLLLPSQIIISRAIDLTCEKDELYAILNDPEKWHLWIENRDSMPVSVNAKKFTLGTTSAVIVSSDTGQIKTNWQVGGGPILPAQFNIIEQEGSSYITLQWQFVQKVKWYPWEKFASIVSDKILGSFMEASLDNLKYYVEHDQTHK